MIDNILDLEDSQLGNLFSTPAPKVGEEGKNKAKEEAANPQKDLVVPGFSSIYEGTPSLEEELEEEIEQEEEEEEIEEEEIPTPVKKVKEKAQPQKTPKTPATKAPAKEQPPIEEEEEESENSDLSDVFASSANYLVNAGIWQDWEGREDEEWNEERWAEELENQVSALVDYRYESIKQSNNTLNTIFEYIENDGDPSRIIDLFSKQRDLQETYDTSTEDGKRGYILDYYTKILGEKKTRAEGILERESNSEGLDTFFEEVKSKYEGHFQKEREKELEQARQEKQVAEQRKLRLQQGVVQELRSMNLEPKLGNELANFALNPRHDYNGKSVTSLELAFAKAQAEPKMLVRLAQFLKDPDKYDQVISQKKQNEATEKAFQFVRTNKTKSTENRTDVPSGSKSGKVSTKPLQF